MKQNAHRLERSLLVFAVWAAIGSIGLLLITEGFHRDSYVTALAGIGCIIASFVAHIIVNAVAGTGFTTGETILGLTSYGFLVLLFVFSVLLGQVSTVGFHIGLTLFISLICGFVIYLVTRHGMRGAFSKFHMGQARDEPPVAVER